MAFFGSSDCSSGPVKQLSRCASRDPGVRRDRLRGAQRKGELDIFRRQIRRNQNSANDFDDFWHAEASHLPQASLDYLLWQKHILKTSENPMEEVLSPVLPEPWATTFRGVERDSNRKHLTRTSKKCSLRGFVNIKNHGSNDAAMTSNLRCLTPGRNSFPAFLYQPTPSFSRMTPAIDDSWILNASLSQQNDWPEVSVYDSNRSAYWETLFTELEAYATPHDETEHETLTIKPRAHLYDLSVESTAVENSFETKYLQHPSRPSNYDFQPNNPFSGSWRAFEEGMAILQKEENLAFAALAFEAACQKDPLHFEAWKMLGSTQAENENDEAAMKAFEDALELNPTSGDVLLGLGIAYINKGYQQKAYAVLENWITTKYPHTASEEILGEDLHARITSLYLSAARLHPSGPQLDPGVQIGLGMLFFSTSRYAESLDCFSTALSLTLDPPLLTTTRSPNSQCQPHLLYNRIGASLANLRRFEEAVEAYEMALVTRPNFVRARYNLAALAFSSGEYEEAARHAVRALVDREAGRAREAKGSGVEDDLMTALKRSLANMGRWDLSERVRPGMCLRDFRRALDI